MNSSLRISLLAALLLAVTACGGRATAENYAKIEAGMTRDQVYDILGKPGDVSGSGIGNLTMSSETWQSSHKVIHITFGNDKVMIKSIGDDDEKK